MSSKGKRGKSKCKKKFLYSGQFKIEFDKNGLAKGENKSFFMSWVGLQFRKKTPYHKVVKDIDPKLYDDIWEYTKEKWNIPNDQAKCVTLKKGKSSMRSFRHELVELYVKKDKTPFEDYEFLAKQHWDSFVANASKPDKSARRNINPTRVGRGGFSGMEVLFESRWNQLVSSYPELVGIQNERSKRYVVSRARLNPITKLYELDTNLQSEGVLAGTLKELYSKEKEMMIDGSYYEFGKDVVTEVVGKGRHHGGRTRLVSNVIGATHGLFSRKKMKSEKDHRSQEDIEVVQQNHYHVDVVSEASLEIKCEEGRTRIQGEGNVDLSFLGLLSAQLPIQATYAEDVLDNQTNHIEDVARPQTTHTEYVSDPHTTHAKNIPAPNLMKFFLILGK
ncbi:hypothetical protein E3N88_12379 [Mikania micrantha]|uniref:Uncharacterized protein n=1 Tax=Mikania micrantha TaxID=192012 RepID=A0A5N6P5C2_9ASTR|nr:hypothetical protein E3N88_12379 [Mikania micrantha]